MRALSRPSIHCPWRPGYLLATAAAHARRQFTAQVSLPSSAATSATTIEASAPVMRHEHMHRLSVSVTRSVEHARLVCRDHVLDVDEGILTAMDLEHLQRLHAH